METQEPKMMPVAPLTLTFVGTDHGGMTAPTGWCITDRRPTPNGGAWTFRDMSLIERAVLRALCEEALRRLDATERGDGD